MLNINFCYFSFDTVASSRCFAIRIRSSVHLGGKNGFQYVLLCQRGQDEVDICCIVAGYRQLQRGVAILVLHIEVCIRAVEKKFENSRLLQLRDPSGLLQETSAVFFILLEDTAGHLKNPRPHPTVTELWRELSYYHVQSYKFQNLQLSVL